MRVIVERGGGWGIRASKIQILLPGVLPPGLESLFVVVGVITIIVKSQTETCSSQSEWPNFCILSVATYGGC